MSGAVWIDRQIKSPTYDCVHRNYFRFAAAIVETDVVDWAILRLSEFFRHPADTTNTWGSARKKNNFRFAADTDGCIWHRLAQLEYVQKTRQRVSIVALTWSVRDHTNRSRDVCPFVFDVVDHKKWWCFRAVPGASVCIFFLMICDCSTLGL